MGSLGKTLLALVAAGQAGGLEKTGGLFKQPTSYERFAEYARKRTSLPVNPYSLATRPMKSAAGRLARGGIGGVFGKLWKGALVGMAGKEFLVGVKEGMASNRKAVQMWGG